MSEVAGASMFLFIHINAKFVSMQFTFRIKREQRMYCVARIELSSETYIDKQIRSASVVKYFSLHIFSLKSLQVDFVCYLQNILCNVTVCHWKKWQPLHWTSSFRANFFVLRFRLFRFNISIMPQTKSSNIFKK